MWLYLYGAVDSLFPDQSFGGLYPPPPLHNRKKPGSRLLTYDWICGLHSILNVVVVVVVLWFAFSIIHGSRSVAKNGEGLGTPITWIMSGGWEVDLGGCPSTNLCAINDRVSFLLVKLSIVDIVNVWGPSYRWSTQWWSLVCYLNVDPSLLRH